jgi:hypothetical protein
MTNRTFSNFDKLQRAAFAETDPEKKVLLLSEVKKAVDDWEQILQNWVSSPSSPTKPGSDEASAATD